MNINKVSFRLGLVVAMTVAILSFISGIGIGCFDSFVTVLPHQTFIQVFLVGLHVTGVSVVYGVVIGSVFGLVTYLLSLFFLLCAHAFA